MTAAGTRDKAGPLDPGEYAQAGVLSRGNEVAVEAALVEVQLVAQAGAAAGLDGDAERQVVAAFGLQQGTDLLLGDVGEDDAASASDGAAGSA